MMPPPSRYTRIVSSSASSSMLGASGTPLKAGFSSGSECLPTTLCCRLRCLDRLNLERGATKALGSGDPFTA
eukprot:3358558-Amphidinium_carterae.1